MTHRVRSSLMAVALGGLAACYHTTVFTGIPGGGERISKPWAHSFLFGLVPPTPIETAKMCRTGVYRIETVHSFPNILVLVITGGIYSPLRIDVTCAYVPRVSAE